MTFKIGSEQMSIKWSSQPEENDWSSSIALDFLIDVGETQRSDQTSLFFADQ